MLYAVKDMPRPRSLTLAAIADAALAVLDRDGLPALTMRTVAAQLGIGTMSLYRYVEDREDLERLVVDRVLWGVDVELPPDAVWRARLTILVERVHAAGSAHPAIVPLLMLHRSDSEGSFRWAEAMLDVLTEAGFTGQRRVIAFRVLVSYVIGVLQYQHLGPLSGPGTDRLAELPAERFPILAETARSARGITPESELREGLAVLLDGLDHGQRPP